MTQAIAYLCIVGAVLSLIYVVGASERMKANPGWRAFFVADHVALIGLSFGALWINAEFVQYIALERGLLGVILVVWHYRLAQPYG